MQKWITFLMTFLVGSVTCANAYVHDSQVSFEAGYRHDSVSWSAEFPSEDPLFKSNSKFKDLNIFQLAVNARTNIGCNVYLRGSADWGWILDGNVEESFNLFQSDNGLSFTQGNNGSGSNGSIIDGRYVFDVSAAIGYPFYFCDCTMSLAPTVGYSFSEQNLWVENNGGYILEGYSDSEFLVLESNGDCGCRNKFISRWYGPFIGIDWDYKPCGECWNLYAQLEYHWAQFSGRRNGHDAFSGFNHYKSKSNDGHGWVFAAGFNYDINHCWGVGLKAKFQDFSASRSHNYNGSDSEFSNFVSSDVCYDIKSHGHWHSYEIGVELVRAF